MSRRPGGRQRTGLGPVRSLVLALVILTAGALVATGAWWVVTTVPALPGDPPTAALGAAAPGGDAPGGDGPVVAVVGDDFTATAPDTAWPTQVCQRLGCRVAPFAVAGTGWTVPGADGRTVDGRLAEVVAADPDVVVIAAGARDVATGQPRVRGSANQVLFRLGQRLPGTPVLVLSPFAPLAPAPPEVIAVRGWLYDASVKHDARFVNVTDLFDAARPGGVDTTGLPTPYGQAMVADLVTPYVEQALPRG